MESGGTILGIKKSDPILVNPLTNHQIPKGLYFLSNLDQNIACIIKTLYCFQPPKTASNGSLAAEKTAANGSLAAEKLKAAASDVGGVIRKGLEKILVDYYPFAGRLTISKEGKLIVDCGKMEGVPFVEAEAEVKMEILGDITTIPDPFTLEQLVHSVDGAKNILELPLLSVQVTKFKCGGFTVGIALNHCMGDGIAAMEFINSWAETTRGGMGMVPLKSKPYLDRSLLASRQPPIIQFPHDEFINIDDISNTTLLYEKEQMTYESFVFDLAKIQRLKKLATTTEEEEEGLTTKITSFVVLTALVWRSRTRALKMKPNQMTKLLFAVDGRSRLNNPPLPDKYFGNAIVLPSVMTTAGELVGKPLSYAVKLVQRTIKMVDEDYIRSSIDYFQVTRARPTLSASLLVTTWTNLAFNTTDFGWGEPTQTGCVTLPEKEMALFLSNNGKGMGTTTVLLGLPLTAMKTFQELMRI